jgi:hypothetical protein
MTTTSLENSIFLGLDVFRLLSAGRGSEFMMSLTSTTREIAPARAREPSLMTRRAGQAPDALEED